jgi:serine/threonine protein kinase
VQSALAEHEVASQSADPDLTSGVGTHWYMSPEQREEGGRYDVKTDVYSLGIIFFEVFSAVLHSIANIHFLLMLGLIVQLWCPFSSSQDRHAALQRLRTHGTFPAHFPESHPRQVKIIRWLLDDQPSRRPTVPELLARFVFFYA